MPPQRWVRRKPECCGLCCCELSRRRPEKEPGWLPRVLPGNLGGIRPKWGWWGCPTGLSMGHLRSLHQHSKRTGVFSIWGLPRVQYPGDPTAPLHAWVVLLCTAGMLCWGLCMAKQGKGLGCAQHRDWSSRLPPAGFGCVSVCLCSPSLQVLPCSSFPSRSSCKAPCPI